MVGNFQMVGKPGKVKKHHHQNEGSPLPSKQKIVFQCKSM